MTAKLFETALGIAEPWSVSTVDFDEASKVLSILVDFKAGSRFGVGGHEGLNPVHDTVTKTYRHLNFFQHECRLQVRTPRVKLPWRSTRTSRTRGQDYITLAADAIERRVSFVTEGQDAQTIEALAADLQAHGCPPENIESVSIDMSPAFIKGVTENLPNAHITFDEFHVTSHAGMAVDKTRRIEQRTDKSLKGLRWSLLKDRSKLKPAAAADLDALIASSPRCALPGNGPTRSSCARSSSANRSTSSGPCCCTGAPASCAARSSR